MTSSKPPTSLRGRAAQRVDAGGVDQSRFGALLNETARLWRQRLDARLKPLGLSQSQWLVLVKLPTEGLSQVLLADLVGVEGASLVGLLDRLETNGWVERRINDADRRAKVVLPTTKAVSARARIQAVAASLRAEVLAGFDDDTIGATIDFLATVRERLEKLDG